MTQGFSGLLDMINGGGAGRAGQKFEGGAMSGILNSLGVKPQGYMDRMQAARPQARPDMPQQAPQMATQPPQPQMPAPSPMQMRGPSQPPQMGGQAQGMANVRPQMPPMPEVQYGPQNGRGSVAPQQPPQAPQMQGQMSPDLRNLAPDEIQALMQYVQSKRGR